MQLFVNGASLPIAQLGPDFLILRKSIDHPPADAVIVMLVDGRERRWGVTLAEGLAADVERVTITQR